MFTDQGFETFRARAQAQGYEQFLERTWAAGTMVEEHSHPFDVLGFVIWGDMWLTVEGSDGEVHLQSGDTFAIERGRVHWERYGDLGARYWVARRT